MAIWQWVLLFWLTLQVPLAVVVGRFLAYGNSSDAQRELRLVPVET